MRRVDITGIALEAHSGAPLVVLREQDAPHRLLPIFIGGPEASSIAIAATGGRHPVPQVHDVMTAIVAALDGRVDAVEVTDLRDGTFLATIRLDGPDGSRHIGSRPSDALALAVRTGAPVFVSDSVLDTAGSLPNPAHSDTDPTTLARPLDDDIDAEIETFRAFLDQLEPGDFTENDTDIDTDGDIDPST